MSLRTLIRCVKCKQEWEVDYEPTACTCDDGGFWQISVDGQTWADQYSEWGPT